MFTQVMQKRLLYLMSITERAAYLTNHELHFTLIHLQLVIKAEQSEYHYHQYKYKKNTYIQVSALTSILHKI